MASSLDAVSRRRQSPPGHRPNMRDLRIILLGKSVTENSRVGNFILRRSAFENEDPPDDVEWLSERVRGKLDDKHITVINNPHLLHLNLTDHQISHEVKECLSLSAPGPHVIVLILKHHDFSEEDRNRVKYVLEKFSEQASKRTIVLTDEERESEEQRCDSINQIIQECGGGHLQLDEEKSEWHSELFQRIEEILEYEEGPFLICDLYEDLGEATSGHLDKPNKVDKNSDHNEDENQDNNTENKEIVVQRKLVSERINTLPKLNVVLCGSDSRLKSSVLNLILNQSERRSEPEDEEMINSDCVRLNSEVCGHLMNLVKLPALFNPRLSDEEIMRQALSCVSLCDPGVHVFLFIIDDDPLTDEDKAETEKIQRIFSSRINKYTMILIIHKSENRTTELNEEMKSVVERFGARHEFLCLNTQGSMLMEKLRQMMEENDRIFFSTEIFWDAQLEKLLQLEELNRKQIHQAQIQTQEALRTARSRDPFTTHWTSTLGQLGGVLQLGDPDVMTYTTGDVILVT